MQSRSPLSNLETHLHGMSQRFVEDFVTESIGWSLILVAVVTIIHTLYQHYRVRWWWEKRK